MLLCVGSKCRYVFAKIAEWLVCMSYAAKMRLYVGYTFNIMRFDQRLLRNAMAVAWARVGGPIK